MSTLGASMDPASGRSTSTEKSSVTVTSGVVAVCWRFQAMR